jgi:transcriptional regulator with XRE-family HTH domain
MHVRATPAQSRQHRADGLIAASEKQISRAIGEELRRTREMRGWSRVELAAHLPSGIGDRTILSYEHGTRHMTQLRFIEICWALGADPAVLLARALQRARIRVETAVLHLDLHELHRDSTSNERFRSMAQWARNALNEHPTGIMTIDPPVVRNLALFVGCPHLELAKYLARFTPDDNAADGGH